MNLSEYQTLALRTEKFLPTVLKRLEHAGLGFITEGGEIGTEIKRMAIYEKTLDDLNKDGKSLRDHLAEEIGDVFWYLAIASDALDADIFKGLLQDLVAPSWATPENLSMDAFSLAAGVGDYSLHIEAALAQGENNFTAEFKQALHKIAQALVNIAWAIGVPVETIAAENIAKLQERFPDAYSNEAAEARADKGGADARNS